MDTKVSSTRVGYSNLSESNARPESDRPRLSEVSACDDVRNWGGYLGLSTSSNPPESCVRLESDRPRLSEVSACDVVRNWGDYLELSTSSNPPESYVKPELDRPRLSEAVACGDVRNWGDYLGLSTSTNPRDFNNAISEVSARECVPFFNLACEDHQSQAIKQLREASKAVAFQLAFNSGVPPEEVKEVSKKSSEFFGRLDSDDPSDAVTLSTSFSANQETIHKNVTEGLINPSAFQSSGKGKHSYNRGSSEASEGGGAFQVPASDYESNLVSSDLDRIRKGYQVPNDFILEVPDFVHNVCLVNKGDIVLYEADFKAGLRLPFHPFIGDLLNRLGLAPGQLTPNAWRIVVFCLNLWPRWSEGSAELSVDEFLYCYKLVAVPNSSSHWYFVARNKNTKLVTNLPSSNGSWKSNYFLVRGEALLEGVNWSWGDPNKSVLDRPYLDHFHLKCVKKAVEFSRRDHNSLVTPRNLTPLSGDAEQSNQKRMNTKIQSQKKAKLSTLGKRKASSVEVNIVLDGPPPPSKGKEVAITPTIDTVDALETMRSKQALTEQDVAVDIPRMIRSLCHAVDEVKNMLAKLLEMDNEDRH